MAAKVLFIIPVPWERLSEADLATLSKMVGAIKRSLSSVQVLTLTETDTDDLQIYHPSRIVALGSTIKVSGKSIQPYQPFGYDQLLVVQADTLDQLDDTKKKNLWNALKEMFKV